MVWGKSTWGSLSEGVEATVPPHGSTLFVAYLKNVGLDLIHENWERDPQESDGRNGASPLQCFFIVWFFLNVSLLHQLY